MPQLLWELKTLVCDICKERPLKKTIEVSRGFGEVFVVNVNRQKEKIK